MPGWFPGTIQAGWMAGIRDDVLVPATVALSALSDAIYPRPHLKLAINSKSPAHPFLLLIGDSTRNVCLLGLKRGCGKRQIRETYPAHVRELVNA